MRTVCRKHFVPGFLSLSPVGFERERGRKRAAALSCQLSWLAHIFVRETAHWHISLSLSHFSLPHRSSPSLSLSFCLFRSLYISLDISMGSSSSNLFRPCPQKWVPERLEVEDFRALGRSNPLGRASQTPSLWISLLFIRDFCRDFLQILHLAKRLEGESRLKGKDASSQPLDKRGDPSVLIAIRLFRLGNWFRMTTRDRERPGEAGR